MNNTLNIAHVARRLRTLRWTRLSQRSCDVVNNATRGHTVAHGASEIAPSERVLREIHPLFMGTGNSCQYRHSLFSMSQKF